MVYKVRKQGSAVVIPYIVQPHSAALAMEPTSKGAALFPTSGNIGIGSGQGNSPPPYVSTRGWTIERGNQDVSLASYFTIHMASYVYHYSGRGMQLLFTVYRSTACRHQF